MNNYPKTYTELIENYLLQDALDCGISVFDFYDMTIKEITKCRDSFIRRREIKRKDSADMLYRLSTLITNGTACIMSKDNKQIEFLEIFGDIFEEENKANEVNKANVQVEVNKQYMKEFAQRINSQKTGGEE